MIYQYCFAPSRRYSDTISQAWRWAVDNIGTDGRWYYDGDFVFHFREERDYTLFLLRWAS